MKFILGQKVEMTQRFAVDGAVIPVTVVKAETNTITQVKGEKDGYTAIQIGYGHKKTLSKPLQGHLKNLANFRWLREFIAHDKVERGQQIDLSTFVVGDKVKVTGVSKGKGFQGVVKRHGFHGAPKTHGHKDQERMPGSIGAGEPQHVFKGKRMGGHMGDENISVLNLEIIEIDQVQNLVYLKGAVPGARNGLVMLQMAGELIVKQAAPVEPAIVEPKVEIATEEPATTISVETPAQVVEVTPEVKVAAAVIEPEAVPEKPIAEATTIDQPLAEEIK